MGWGMGRKGEDESNGGMWPKARQFIKAKAWPKDLVALLDVNNGLVSLAHTYGDGVVNLAIRDRQAVSPH